MMIKVTLLPARLGQAQTLLTSLHPRLNLSFLAFFSHFSLYFGVGFEACDEGFGYQVNEWLESVVENFKLYFAQVLATTLILMVVGY